MGGVDISQRQAQPVATVRGRVGASAIPQFLGPAFADVMRVLGEQGQAPTGPPFARYERDGGELSVVAGFPCERAIQPSGRVTPETLPGGPVASVLYRGPYAGVSAAYVEVPRWLTEHGYAPSGAPWESYLDGPEVDQPRTLVEFPCARVDGK